MMTYRLSDIVAAPFTPFGTDGELRLEMVPRQAALRRDLEADGFLEWCSRVPGTPPASPTRTFVEVRS